MDIDLGPGVRFIESRMVDTCRIERDTRQNYDEVLDEETGQLVPPDPQHTTVYEGKCNITTLREQERLIEVGERLVSLRTFRVLIPHTETAVHVGDVLTMTSVAVDPYLLGRPMSIIDIGARSLPTYRRLIVQDTRNASVQP